MSDDMEKYGVVTEDSDAPKTAELRTTTECPNCGAETEPTDKVNVRKCPNCGTQPFEGSNETA